MNETHILRRQGFDNGEVETSKYSFLYKVLHIAFIVYSLVSVFQINDVESLKNLSILFSPVVIGLFLIVFAFVKYIASLNQNTYLELTESGMSYKNNMHRLFQRFDPEWSFAWEDTKSISFKPKSKSMMTDNRALNLSIELKNGKVFDLRPIAWIDPSNKKVSELKNIKRNFSAFLNPKKWIEVLTLQSSLVKILQSKELLPNEVEFKDFESEWTSITKSKIGFSMLLLFLSGLTYFAIDNSFLLSEFYAQTPSYFLFAFIGLIVGILSYSILKKSSLLPIETWIMTIMLGVTGALVAYPLILRINEWTSEEALHEYTYSYSSDGIWLSKLPDIPNVDINRLSFTYVSEFKKGDTYDFELRRGGLGFYQVNLAPMKKMQHEFFKER